MDTYPGELLVGVFPLIFCADVTLTSKNPEIEEPHVPEENDGGDDINDFDNPSQAPTTQPPSKKKGPSAKSQFDRFLNAMAAALMESEEDPLSNGLMNDMTGVNSRRSLFRSDTDEDSDTADDEWLTSSAGGFANGVNVALNPSSSFDGGFSEDGSMRTIGASTAGGTANTGRRSMGMNFRLGRSSNYSTNSVGSSMFGNMLGNNSSSKSPNSTNQNTSYAKSLHHGQGFAQRARIVAISARHGFPPSKDPTGDKNRIHVCFRNEPTSIRNVGMSPVATSPPPLLNGFLDTDKLIESANQNPMDGILPSGWLEKHAHALPSVLIVVAQVFGQDKQEEQDKHLLDTLQNLKINLAEKRRCEIHIIGIVQHGVSMIQAEQWSQTIANKVNDGDDEDAIHEITLLDVKEDLDSSQESSSSSLAMRQLHKAVRDSSLSYYIHQARRTKLKLQKMAGRDPLQSKSPLLLPLAIRYCFKVAMFYEFQWKHEKSLKFLIEAYRYVDCYYRYLLQVQSASIDSSKSATGTDQKRQAATQSFGPSDATKPVKILDSSQMSSTTSRTSSTAEEDYADGASDGNVSGEGVELALSTPRGDGDGRNAALSSIVGPPPSADMVYQCRAVADWLNFKLLYTGLVSQTEGGLLAASTQWQKHGQAFCSPRKGFVSRANSNPGNRSGNSHNEWYDWSYVAQQRVVVSQLLERYPPRAFGDLGGKHFDEVLLRCSAWRTYEAAAEALLNLGVHVGRALKYEEESPSSPSSGEVKGADQVDNMRSRYVGGLDNEGLLPWLKEESQQNHQEKALDCIKRAIALFERELEKAKTNGDGSGFVEKSWSRSGSRMYYLAGGILHGLNRHAEATPYLETAVKYSKSWRGLELVVRRMLIECYEKQLKEKSAAGEATSQAIASMILDSYFNAEMSNSNLRRALENFGAVTGATNGAIKWYRDCIDEADSSLPFSFALTFPSATHAVAGDGVKASVLIKSNLDYAVHVNSVTLLSLAGQITLPSNDLLSAKNANEGSDGGIIIQANTEILLSTQIGLPRDLNAIAIDERGNGGQKEGTAGKGSFSKSARPRTAGITSAAGARLVTEGEFAEEGAQTDKGQWSLRYLGGKPLRCDGIRLVFFPVYAQASSEGKSCEIELTIEKKQPKTATKIKRTPFEEDNYISSAWSRPRYLPMNRGPRCLRVLAPTADLKVTNLTESYTNGKVLEGTVNRILLKLEPGPDEDCSDMQIRVACASLLITSEGTTKRIIAGDAGDDQPPAADRSNPRVRTPVLVRPDPDAPSSMTEYGYELPSGWVLAGDDGQGVRDKYMPLVATLKSGDATYAYFDVFRPTPQITRMDGILQVGEQAEDLIGEWDMCQTDIDVAICYGQERPKHALKATRGRKRGKRSSQAPAGDGEDVMKATKSPSGARPKDSDLVIKEYMCSVFWGPPIQTTFSPGPDTTYPCGNRHPSNVIPDPDSGILAKSDAENEMVLVDGDRVTTKCILEGASTADGLSAEIKNIRFEDNEDPQCPCNFSIVSGHKGKANGLLYESDENDPSRNLNLESTLSVAWTADVAMKNEYVKGSVSAPLGTISVDWFPIPLELPEEMEFARPSETTDCHGPLVLSKPSTCRFMGPPCYVERAPFHVVKDDIPASPRVAEPFKVLYHVQNKTNLHQRLDVMLNDSEPETDGGSEPDGFLVAGVVNGTVSLGPFETKCLSYMAVPTRSGKLMMPSFRVTSDRFKSWVIRDDTPGSRSICILP